jgi:hypothetical protein
MRYLGNVPLFALTFLSIADEIVVMLLGCKLERVAKEGAS